jgi:hypothetical protein
MAGRGPRHPEANAAASFQSRVMLTGRSGQERGHERRPGGEAPAAPKPGSHNVGLDDERRVDLGWARRTGVQRTEPQSAII